MAGDGPSTDFAIKKMARSVGSFIGGLQKTGQEGSRFNAGLRLPAARLKGFAGLISL
jgi:hypothetical protein